MALFQLPGSGLMAAARDLALIDRLWRQWSPSLSLDPALQTELHEHLRASMPAPLKYYRAMLRPACLGRRAACLSRSRCPCCSSTVPTTAASSPRRSTTDIGSPHRTRWRWSPTSVTSCTSRPPRRSRNGSRHGPSSGSLVQVEVRTALLHFRQYVTSNLHFRQFNGSKTRTADKLPLAAKNCFKSQVPPAFFFCQVV